MKSIVCSVTLIYLCLGNVAGYIVGGFNKKPQQQHSTEKFKSIDSSVRKWYYTCISEKKRDHQWYHGYPNDNLQQLTYTSNIPTQTSVKTTKYFITLETFDNNTEIHCDIGSNVKVETVVWYLRPIHFITDKVSSFWSDTPDYNHSYIFLIRIESYETLTDSKEPAFLKYNETQKVSFICPEYNYKTNTFVGVINTTTNRIETHNKIFLDTIFDKSQNGTVLCCIYYEESREGSKSSITRHVTKKTLLVYDETVTVPVTDGEDRGQERREDSSEDRVSDFHSSNSTGEDTKSPDDIGNQVVNPGNQATNSGNHPSASNQNTIIYTVSAVAVVFILLVVSVIYLKHCRKKPKVEVDTKVFYADLDFLRRNEPESLPREGPEEESPYAQIIGELRPQRT